MAAQTLFVKEGWTATQKPEIQMDKVGGASIVPNTLNNTVINILIMTGVLIRPLYIFLI